MTAGAAPGAVGGGAAAAAAEGEGAEAGAAAAVAGAGAAGAAAAEGQPLCFLSAGAAPAAGGNGTSSTSSSSSAAGLKGTEAAISFLSPFSSIILQLGCLAAPAVLDLPALCPTNRKLVFPLTEPVTRPPCRWM